MLSARLRLFLALCALWCACFGLGLALDDRLNGPWVLSAATLSALGALSLPLSEPLAALRAFSALLLHSDGLHLAGNIAALALVVLTWPPNSRLRTLLAVLLLGGAVAAGGSILAYSQQGGLSVGPSGALCAALSYALCHPAPPTHKILWLSLSAAFLIGGELSGGDQGAHIGGLLFGVALGLLGRQLRRRQAENSLRLAAGDQPH